MVHTKSRYITIMHVQGGGHHREKKLDDKLEVDCNTIHCAIEAGAHGRGALFFSFRSGNINPKKR